MHVECNVIGKVHNSVNEQTDTDWGKVISEVVLEESLRPGLKGLEDFSHVLILTYLDQASFQREKHLFRSRRVGRTCR
jgi:tRNA (Thr-GGU) A37 N-methylase